MGLHMYMIHGVNMQKSLIIVAFSALLLLCVGAQMYSINRSNPDAIVNYYSIH